MLFNKYNVFRESPSSISYIFPFHLSIIKHSHIEALYVYIYTRWYNTISFKLSLTIEFNIKCERS